MLEKKMFYVDDGANNWCIAMDVNDAAYILAHNSGYEYTMSWMEQHDVKLSDIEELPLDKVIRFRDGDGGSSEKTVAEWIEEFERGDFWCSEA